MQCSANQNPCVSAKRPQAGRLKGSVVQGLLRLARISLGKDMLHTHTFSEQSLLIKEVHQYCFLKSMLSDLFYSWLFSSDCLNLMRLPLPVPGLLCTPRRAGPPWCPPPSRVMGQQWPLGTKTSISFLGCLSPLQIRSSSRNKACKSLCIDPSTNHYVN